MANVINTEEQKAARARAKWDRNARLFDWMTRLTVGRTARTWLAKVWAKAEGPRILEVGAGTGRSFPYYPRGMSITAIDLSGGMLARAKKRAHDLGVNVDLRQMDVQKMDFPDNSFDTVVAICTFCSVPDPVLGLKEIRRVVQPEGKIILLEHMRHEGKFLGALMDFINPAFRAIGPAINRRTLDNIRAAGLVIETVEDLAMGGIMKFIVARPGKETRRRR